MPWWCDDAKNIGDETIDGSWRIDRFLDIKRQKTQESLEENEKTVPKEIKKLRQEFQKPPSWRRTQRWSFHEKPGELENIDLAFDHESWFTRFCKISLIVMNSKIWRGVAELRNKLIPH